MVRYTDEDCLSSLQEAADILGKSPSKDEYQTLDISPHAETIAQRFGRWNKAKKEAGLEHNLSSRMDVQDDPPEILDIDTEDWLNLRRSVRNRKRNQAKWAKYKLNKGCGVCGYDEHPKALEFHHTNPDNKVDTIGRLISQGYGKDVIKDEVNKCIVLCSNCHQIESSDDIYDV